MIANDRRALRSHRSAMTSSVDTEADLQGDDSFARALADGAAAPPLPLPLPGTVLGKEYRVERCLGKGGFGSVYEATDTGDGPLSGRRVAIKFVRYGRRFVDHEIDALKGLGHPNIVTVLDAGTWQPEGVPHAIPFLVMQLLLEGRTLARGVRAPDEALAIGRQLAAALAHMHGKGIYHLDLKPENIFASEGGAVVILDLGIAKVLGSEPTQRPEDKPPAPPWAGCGTPPYAAPEQVDPKRWGEVDGRADVHAFGMLFGELLTGRLPRIGPDALALAEQMAAVDARLVALVERCIDADPSRRLSDGKALKQELDNLQRNPRAPVAPVDEPFRALRPFETRDKGLFFGRDRHVQDLVKLVNESRLVVLHGASGTGKTSLLRAGLRPALSARFLWLDLPAPTETTFDLGDAIVARATEELRGHGQDLSEREPDRALVAVAQAVKGPVLVVLDQFEELFQRRTVEQIGETAAKVADTLCKVSRLAADVRVLLSLRDDYMGHLRHLQAGLPDIYQRGLLLSALDHSGARQAIEEPFRLGGVGISHALAERMVNELDKDARETGPVQLQLLCDELYQTARKRSLAQVDDKLYKELGGAGRVLGRHVERVLRELGPDQPTAMRLLQQMLAAGGNRQPSQGLRRIADGTGLGVPDVKRAMKVLVDGRLVEASERTAATPKEGKKKKKRATAAAREPVFRIAHDLVARAVWERLEEQETHDIGLRDTVRALARQVPEGGLGRALWFVFGLKAQTREELLGWARREAPGATNEDRAFLRRMSAWMRWIRGGKRAAAGMAAVAVLGTFYWLNARALAKQQQVLVEQEQVLVEQERVRVEQERVREAQARTAEAEAERELQRDPGKTLAWIAEAARLRGGIEHEPDPAFHEHWLLAREAWSEGVGWIAADHGSAVTSVAFSPPELVWMDATGAMGCKQCWPHQKLLVSAGKDGSVRVLNLEKGGVAELLPGGGKTAAEGVTFSPDGSLVASCDREGVVRIWDVTKREPPRELRLPVRLEGGRVAFSYDGRWLAVPAAHSTIVIWRREEKDAWTASRFLDMHKASIVHLAFSPRDRTVLASGDAMGHVFSTDVSKRFDGATGGSKELPLPGTQPMTSSDLAFSNDGALLIAAIGRSAAAFSRRSGKSDSGFPSWEPLGKPIEPGTGGVYRVATAGWANSLNILTGTSEGDVIQWGRADGEWKRFAIAKHNGSVRSLKFSRDGRWILSSGFDGSVRATYRGGRWGRQLRGHEGGAMEASLSSDGLLAASGGIDGHVRIWPVTVGRTGLHSANRPVESIASEDPKKLVVAGLDDGRIADWRNQRVEPSLSKDSLHSRIRGLCLIPQDRIVAGSDGGEIVIAGAGGVGQVWHTKKGLTSVVCRPDGTLVLGYQHSVELWRIEANLGLLVGNHDNGVVSLALTPDGHTVVSGALDNRVRVWDLEAVRPSPPAPAPVAERDVGQWVTAVAALSPLDILFGTVDGKLHRWRPETGRVENLAPDHHGAFQDIAVHQGLVATAGEDGLLLRWLDSGTSRPLRGHEGPVSSILFSRDGGSLVSGGLDSHVLVWPLPPLDPHAFADWLDQNTPWHIENGVPKPKPVPPFKELAGPAPAPPSPACIESCRKKKANGTLLAGFTLETCVLAEKCEK